MTLSQLALEDVGALCSGPLLLMADPMGPLLDQDEEEALSPSFSLEEKAPASPSPSFSSYASTLSPYQAFSSTPPSSPPSFLGTKADVDSLPWLGASDLLDPHIGADDGKYDDAFAGMEWMTEKIDLNEFDLVSLIGSCSSDDSPSSPEDLLAALDHHMDLDLESYGTTAIPALPLEPPHSGVIEDKKTEVSSDQQVILKSQPPSPSPPSPALTLELESEADMLEAEKLATSLTATIIPDPSENIQTSGSFVLSLPTSAQLVVLVTKENEPPIISLPEPSAESSPQSSDVESDSGIESDGGSPPHLPSPPPTPTAGSSRTKPYSKPEPTTASSPSTKVSKVKSVSGAPKVVEKKLKKMEQNKTAATRYRQKKRVEQEQLSKECEELDKRNQELTEKAESISREIQYLKDLMEEVRKHHRSKTNSVA